jgi:hypothetical protein
VGNEHGVDLSQKGGQLPFAERQPYERVAAWVSRVLDRGIDPAAPSIGSTSSVRPPSETTRVADLISVISTSPPSSVTALEASMHSLGTVAGKNRIAHRVIALLRARLVKARVRGQTRPTIAQRGTAAGLQRGLAEAE